MTAVILFYLYYFSTTATTTTATTATTSLENILRDDIIFMNTFVRIHDFCSLADNVVLVVVVVVVVDVDVVVVVIVEVVSLRAHHQIMIRINKKTIPTFTYNGLLICR
jgi:hypothetical protein